MIALLFAHTSGELSEALGNLANLTVLDVSSNALTGAHSIRSARILFSLTLHLFWAGELPKQLPVSLEVLNLGDDYRNNNKFIGGIPSEWSALSNLKSLKMACCGLHGQPLSIQY